jgi:hypothetical protein
VLEREDVWRIGGIPLPLITSALHEMNGQLQAPDGLPREKAPWYPLYRTLRTLGMPQSRSRRYAEGSISLPCQESNPDSSVVQLIT